MQVWGAYVANMPHVSLSEARIRAHRILLQTSQAMRACREAILNLTRKYDVPEPFRVTQSLEEVACIFDLLVKNYQRLYNGECNEPLWPDIEDNFVRYTESE